MLSTPQLALDLEGQLLTSEDTGYDEARTVFAAHIDRRPALIARVAGPDDIARVIAHARQTGSELAVRSGGHSPAGHGVCDGGIVIDLSALRSFELDTAGRTAWAGAGLTAGAFTLAAGEHGLATGFGDTGSVGIGGITLAGGIGFLVRKHGLTIDNLLAAEIVTADGRLRRVDAQTEPELFWALRGGGGNFGVVTRLKYRLHPVDTVVGGLLVLPATPEVIAGFVAEAGAAPDELSTIANVMSAPPLPFLPEELHGTPVVLAKLVHAGDPATARRNLAPFRALAEPAADLLRPMRYPELLPVEEWPTAAMVTRASFAGGLGLRQAETILERIGESSAPMAACELRVLGGAMARVPADATAFAHRHSRMMINVAAIYDPSTSSARSTRPGPAGSPPSCTTATPAPTQASSPTRARRASAPPTPAPRGSGWPRSRPPTTPTTCSGSTKTTRRGREPASMPHIDDPAQPPRVTDNTCSPGRRRPRRRAQAPPRSQPATDRRARVRALAVGHAASGSSNGTPPAPLLDKCERPRRRLAGFRLGREPGVRRRATDSRVAPAFARNAEADSPPFLVTSIRRQPRLADRIARADGRETPTWRATAASARRDVRFCFDAERLRPGNPVRS